MAFGPDDLLLGRIALHYKLVSQEQLNQAATRHEQGAGGLGEILVSLGVLTPGQLDKLLAVQRDYVAKQQQAAAAPAPPAPAPPAAPAPVAPAAPPAPAPEPPRGSWRQAGRRLDAVLTAAVERRASDVHIHTAAPLQMRINGQLQEMEAGRSMRRPPAR